MTVGPVPAVKGEAMSGKVTRGVSTAPIGQVLADAGLIPEQITRVLIDIKPNDLVRVYYSTIATEEKFRATLDAIVEAAKRGEVLSLTDRHVASVRSHIPSTDLFCDCCKFCVAHCICGPNDTPSPGDLKVAGHCVRCDLEKGV